MRAEAEQIAPGLHVVATPIGNLRDITLRALGTLAAADAVVAEDTRVSRNLLAHYGIATPLVAYHEHNAAAMRPVLLARLQKGERLALISDAGTPLVSDPGFKLVARSGGAGLPVTSAPGPSAVLAALVVAGLPTDRFFFEGFLPAKSGARRARIAELASIPGTLVLFESPRRLAETLADLAAVLGPRQAAVARELTKHFESVRRGALDRLAADYERDGPPKGEIVLLVAPPGEDAPALDGFRLSTSRSAPLCRNFRSRTRRASSPPRPASRAGRFTRARSRFPAEGKTAGDGRTKGRMAREISACAPKRWSRLSGCG